MSSAPSGGTSSAGGANGGTRSGAGGSTSGGRFATGGWVPMGGASASGAPGSGGAVLMTGGAPGASGGASGASGGPGNGGSAGAATGGSSFAGSSAKGGAGSGGAGASGTGGVTSKGGAGGSAGSGVGGATGGGGGGGVASPCPGFAFCDDFQDGNITANPTWISTPSAFSVVDDGATKVLRQEPMEAWAYGGSVTWTNMTVQARVKVLNFGGTSSSNCGGLVARWQGSSTPHYMVAFCANGSVGVYKDGDLVDETNGTKAVGIVANTWYVLKLQVSGVPGSVSLAVSIDETPTFTVTDADTSNPVAAGYMALGSDKSVSIAYDDVKVSVP